MLSTTWTPLDTVHPVVYTTYMPTKTVPLNSVLREPDGQFASSGAKTSTRTFRINKRDDDRLDQMPYKNNGSVLVRLLLEMYFDDRLPAVKMKFNSLLQRK